MSHTDWLPGILVLSVGMILAGLALFFMRLKTPRTTPLADSSQDAQERAAKLIEQLRELQLDRGRLTEAQFLEEKMRLEQLAAQALRQQSSSTVHASAPSEAPSSQKTTTAPPGFLQRHPQLAGATWGAGVVLFFVVIGLVLSRTEKPRDDNMGNSRTAMQENGTVDASADSELKAAIEQLRAHPEDTELAARVGHELIRRREFEEARAVTERALGADPFHVENRIHRALLRSIFNDNASAARELTHLANTHPDASEALLFLGMLQLSQGANGKAVETLERFIAEAPANEVPPHLLEAITGLRRQAGGGP